MHNLFNTPAEEVTEIPYPGVGLLVTKKFGSYVCGIIAMGNTKNELGKFYVKYGSTLDDAPVVSIRWFTEAGKQEVIKAVEGLEILGVLILDASFQSVVSEQRMVS